MVGSQKKKRLPQRGRLVAIYVKESLSIRKSKGPTVRMPLLSRHGVMSSPGFYFPHPVWTGRHPTLLKATYRRPLKQWCRSHGAFKLANHRAVSV